MTDSNNNDIKKPKSNHHQFLTPRGPLRDIDLQSPFNRNPKLLHNNKIRPNDQQIQSKTVKTMNFCYAENGKLTHNSNQSKISKRIKGMDLRSWQKQWKDIMMKTVVYFDSVQGKDKKVDQYLTLLGAVIEPFFDSRVTLVITKRAIDKIEHLPSHDVLSKAQSMNTKIWTYDKLCRFLNNLLFKEKEKVATATAGRNQNLSNLLMEEKANGPGDRDPRVRRDDFHYFKGPYVLVYDPKNKYRTFLAHEYQKPLDPIEGSWPQFRVSPIGRCPFVKYKGYSKQKKHSSKELVATHKQIASTEKNNEDKYVSRSQSDLEALAPTMKVEDVCIRNSEDNDIDMIKTPEKQIIPSLFSKNSGVHDDVHNHSMFFEIAASGVNISTIASVAKSMMRSTDTPNLNKGNGNGLAPTTTQIPSKQVNQLKRKMFEKRKPPTYPTIKTYQYKMENLKAKKNEKMCGFCENCKEQYDDFESHIHSKKHTRFALDDSNFTQIDLLIKRIRENSDLW